MTDVPTEELRPCICADPENCTIVPEGRLCKRLHLAEQGSEAYAIPLGTITDGVVHRMCHYLKSGEPECSKCPAGVTTAYGDGEPGCYGIAFETLQMARSMLYEAALTAQDGERHEDGRRSGRSKLTTENLSDFVAGKPIGQWREGGIDLQASNGWITVSVERGGKYVQVIRTFHGGITAHTVWPSGIDAAISAEAGSKP